MEQEVIKLHGPECYEIALISKGNAYKNGKRAENGEKYRQYRYEGVVFTIPESDPFNSHYDNGKLAMVKLLKGTRTATVTTIDEKTGDEVAKDVEVNSIQFDSCITTAQDLGWKKHEGNLIRIEKIATATELSDESVEKLMNAVV